MRNPWCCVKVLRIITDHQIQRIHALTAINSLNRVKETLLEGTASNRLYKKELIHLFFPLLIFLKQLKTHVFTDPLSFELRSMILLPILPGLSNNLRGNLLISHHLLLIILIRLWRELNLRWGWGHCPSLNLGRPL